MSTSVLLKCLNVVVALLLLSFKTHHFNSYFKRALKKEGKITQTDRPTAVRVV